MNYNANFSIALNILERKIANLNIELIENPSEETKIELEKYLNLKKDLYTGNVSLIEKIVNNGDK